MKKISSLVICLAVLAGLSASAAPSVPASTPASVPVGETLRVAAVQLRSTPDLAANVTNIKRYLADCAARRVQIVAFPECAVTGYTAAAIQALSPEAQMAAEKEIAAACREHGIAAIVGIPERRNGKIYNCALIIDASGGIIARYDKAQPVGQDREWHCVAGTAPSTVFSVGGARAAVIICHDSRFPELARLPVLAGARVIFYISAEAILMKESKMVPYRAQVQALAVENTVFVVHANPPADGLRSGSHGQSRIVGPDGNILCEATQLQEELLVQDLNLSKATAEFALESLQGPLGDWWREGLKRVPLLK